MSLNYSILTTPEEVKAINEFNGNTQIMFALNSPDLDLRVYS